MTTLIVVIALTLGIVFLASLLEAVLLSTTHAYVALLEEEGHRAGALLARIRSNINEPIAAILTLNTIAQIIGSSVGGAIALHVLGDHGIAIFSAVLTLAVLVLSEIVPKTIGARYWKQIAVPAAYVLRAMVIVMKPVLLPLSLVHRVVAPTGESAQTVSRAELEVMAEIGRREGAIDQEEWEVVTNVMNLDQLVVAEVMTPRTSVVAVAVEASVDEAKDVMLGEGHLRLPAYEGSIDHVVGVLLARDLWRADREGVTAIRELLRPPIFVPESKAVEDLIREMRQQRLQMAIVLDEFGGTAGLVTLEDLIEQIIGEIQDEHELEPLPFEEEMAGEVRVRGDVPLWEVNERFELSLPEEVYDTLGGYVFGQLGRIAEVGDEVVAGRARFRVVSMEGRRISRVAFSREPEDAEE
jgi:putative hemolysin